MKFLDGSEIAGYIKERQARQVRALRQAHHIFPKLAIVQTVDSPVIDTYVRMKKRYGSDILIDVDLHKVDQSLLKETITSLNNDPTVYGIIVQLPLASPDETQEAVDLVAPEKDVDGLGARALLTPATPMAIDWLLAAYNVALEHKKIAIIGNGRLVGAPLSEIWKESGYNVTILGRENDLALELPKYDVIVTATGTPNLVKSEHVHIGAVVVDAGTAAEHGKIIGDIAPELRERDDLTITPPKGGVGPLTVVALFDNVIQAAQIAAKKEER